MSRLLPALLSLFVVASACAQDAPASDMAGGDMDAANERIFDLAPQVPSRAADEARPSPNASVGQAIGTTYAFVQYGRPSLRGREAFGEDSPLAPLGQIWRTGANEAPTFTVTRDVMVQGERLPAGTYALFTIPGPDEWTIIFNKTAEQWGAFRYDEGEDALRVMADALAAPTAEQFHIRFENVSDDEATMLLHWGDVGVPVTIATN